MRSDLRIKCMILGEPSQWSTSHRVEDTTVEAAQHLVGLIPAIRARASFRCRLTRDALAALAQISEDARGAVHVVRGRVNLTILTVSARSAPQCR